MFVFTISDLIGLVFWGILIAGASLVWAIGKLQKLAKRKQK